MVLRQSSGTGLGSVVECQKTETGFGFELVLPELFEIGLCFVAGLIVWIEFGLALLFGQFSELLQN